MHEKNPFNIIYGWIIYNGQNLNSSPRKFPKKAKKVPEVQKPSRNGNKLSAIKQ